MARTRGAVARAFEQHHERRLDAQRELRQAVALRVAAPADGSRERGEVLGADHDRPGVDEARARDDPVGRDVAAHQRSELAKRTRVE